MLALILASHAFAPPACAVVRGTSRAAVHMQFKMPEMPGGLPKFQMPKLGIDMPNSKDPGPHATGFNEAAATP